MGLGIIFCITEVQILQDVQAQILEGQAPDRRIATLMSYFPNHYCAFECVTVLRMVFFLAFNVINAYSLCLTVNETKQRIFKTKKTQKRQKKITKLMQDLYNLQSSKAQIKDKLNLKVEINAMKEFGDTYRQSEKDLQQQVSDLRKCYIPVPMFATITVKKWL